MLNFFKMINGYDKYYRLIESFMPLARRGEHLNKVALAPFYSKKKGGIILVSHFKNFQFLPRNFVTGRITKF